MTEEFKTITKRTQALLAGGECDDVLAVADTDGCLDAMAAFANAGRPATILVGVEGRAGQFKVIGCSDTTHCIELMQSFAAMLVPPISLRCAAENTDRHPLVRVDILASNRPPHVTPDGRYLLRANGSNSVLQPDSLRNLVLRREQDNSLGMLDRLERLHNETAQVLEDLRQLASPQTTFVRMGRFQNSLDAILRYFNIPDPQIETKIQSVRKLCEVALMRGAEYEQILQVVLRRYPTVTRADATEQLEAALEQLDAASPGWRNRLPRSDIESA